MKTKEKGRGRRAAVLCAGTMMYALLFALGSQIDSSGQTEPRVTLLRFLAALPVGGAALFALLEGVFPRLARGKTLEAGADQGEKPFCTAGAFLLILLSFVPMLLIQYPGSFMYDTQRQTFQVATGQYTTFHPLLHTLFLGLCLSAYDVLQSFERCAALYSVLQMTMMAGAFALTCASISRSCSRRAARAATAFFCLYPAHMAFASNCIKDSLFSAFFALWIACCLETVYTRERTRGQTARLILSGVLACLMRNNMIYALLAWLVILILQRKRMGRLARCALLIAVLAYGANQGLVALTDASGGSVGEMLCVPMQQLSRAYRDANACFSEEDRETMDALFEEQSYTRYEPTLADPVKLGIRTDALQAEPMRALRMWLRIGRQCPGIYLDAFLNTALPFLYPYREYQVAAPYIETGMQYGVLTSPFGQEPIVQPRRFAAIRTWMDEHIWATGADGVPVVRELFNCGLIIWLMLLCVLRAAYEGEWPVFFVLLLAVLLWCTYLLGPVMQGRYLYPFVCILPALLAGCGGRRRAQPQKIKRINVKEEQTNERDTL
ncbi:MAG: DUF6020 family protein [Clostridia bacterium]|nr:DUF6020 family protein [Clostridia bacterium]